MAKNIYADPLHSFTFDEMLGILLSFDQENLRLDFKRLEAGRPKLAHLACAFANAEGGILAINFSDPSETRKKPELCSAIDVSDKAVTAIVAAMSARVQPPMPLEAHGYESSDGRSFLLIRVSPSQLAPHEYLYLDESRNLPVRRGTIIGSLRLSEIDMLRARGLALPSESPLGPKPYPAVNIQPDATTAAGFFFGLSVKPVTYGLEAHVLDADDDWVLVAAELSSRGMNGGFHEALQITRTADGAVFSNKAPGSNDMRTATQAIEIYSDGDITLKFAQTTDNVPFQLYRILATGYMIAQDLYYHLRLSAVARFRVIYQLDANARDTIISQRSDRSVNVDLSRQTFAEAFTEMVLRITRQADVSARRSSIRELLSNFERDNIHTMPTALERWLS